MEQPQLSSQQNITRPRLLQDTLPFEKILILSSFISKSMIITPISEIFISANSSIVNEDLRNGQWQMLTDQFS
jgi:hypothetical protein